MYLFRPPLLYLSIEPHIHLSRILMFQISMNAAAVLEKLEQRVLTLSTRTRVAVSPVTWERTASRVSV